MQPLSGLRWFPVSYLPKPVLTAYPMVTRLT